MERKTVLSELENYKAQLVTAKKSYENLVKTKEVTIKEARTKLESLQQKLSQVKMKEAEAELQEMSQSMVGELGAGGDTMNRLEEQLNERLELATGKAQVAKDAADFSDIVMKESEQKALESQALAELAASMGMDYSPYGPAPTAEKSMGPQEGVALQKNADLDII
jgi:phage shock protein A